ncbi:hypothetical protein ACFORG_13425 [Lutimaribacter marinistellae]|uniref:DUF5681 domain-containing protein n=1 Tax=Lutimaribacter marinistellae TaxID=1820329 RepID=A0ABV7TKP7_9RHOB
MKTTKGRGGKRPGAGRPKGSGAKASRLDRQNMILKLREHGELALDVLVEIAQHGESESARISASTQILDRAYGRPGTIPDMRVDEDGEREVRNAFDEFFKDVTRQKASPDIVATRRPPPEKSDEAAAKADLFDDKSKLN